MFPLFENLWSACPENSSVTRVPGLTSNSGDHAKQEEKSMCKVQVHFLCASHNNILQNDQVQSTLDIIQSDTILHIVSTCEGYVPHDSRF